ncbi:MAG: aminotransferase class I/II-fold pyridoxal phosphate-dependent enzyme [Proteobacteria bacterium]|nr:aminotransferase class I/II-fold pyridoxal phosphate-dependent enzyme [Pseudomonadota bacterium]
MNLSRRALLSASALLLARPRTVAAQVSPAAPDIAIVPATDARPEPLILCWNENPYGPSPAARAVLSATAPLACRYPQSEIGLLLEALSKKEGVSVDHLALGAGSGEILSCLGALVARKGGSLIAAEPTFMELPEYARRAGVTISWVPVNAQKRHDLKAMRAAVGPTTRAVYVCNPNNPTGTAEPRAILREFILSLPPDVTCIVDEAYLDFADDPAVGSVADLVGNSRRLVVLRTFSKLHGMAGVRCGYAITRPDIVNDIAGVRMSTPNIFAMRAARASLGDLEFLADTRRRILASRRRICGELDALGLAYAKSQGNFVFFDTHMPIVEFEQIMLARNIRVGRPFPPFDTWCRITVGRESEVDAFLAALRAVHAPALRKAV